MHRRDLLLAGGAAGLDRPTAAVRAKLGFALGSGALHAWAHIGVIRGCARAGLAPATIAGSSAGAAVGALWAGGLADLAFQSVHILGNALAREQTRRADHTLRLDLHHLMQPRFDAQAVMAAGERALLDLAPLLGGKRS